MTEYTDCIYKFGQFLWPNYAYTPKFRIVQLNNVDREGTGGVLRATCSAAGSGTRREGSTSSETSELKGDNMKRTTLTMLEFLIEYKNYSLDDAKEACTRYQDGTWIPWTVICDICDYNDYYNDSIFSPIQA